MARQTRIRTRKYEPRPEREPERYEASSREPRLPQRPGVAETRMGPYEFHRSVELGYEWDRRIA